MIEIYVIRHTKVDIPQGLCYGQLDVELASSYPDEFQAIRPQLENLTFKQIFSSPLNRCMRLAEDLKLGEIQRDARLMELSFGLWEGRLWTEIDRATSEHWTQDVVHRAPPGGETFSELLQRVQSFLLELKQNQPEGKILLLTHAGVIRAIRHLTEGLPIWDCLTLSVAHGSVYRGSLEKI